MTKQLENEKIHKEKFKQNLKKFGLKILHEYTSNENKKNMTNADYLCRVITNNNPLDPKEAKITVSLKTKAGSFMIFNSGTTLKSILFRDFDFKKSEKELILRCQKKVKELRSRSSAIFWEDDMSTKQSLKDLYVSTFYELFNNNRQFIEHIYNMFNTYQSDYVYLENELKKTDPYIVNYSVIKVKTDTVKSEFFALDLKQVGQK